ncbi:MAG: helix-turn-helix transcriptional regulator [Salinisphaeraceae bacterium]
MHERLKEARRALGYTQKTVAEAVGGKLRSWQDYESAKTLPGSQVLFGLANLGINVNWILTGEGPMWSAQAPAATGDTAAATVDEGILEDVLIVLREREQRTGRRLAPDREARLVAQIYQYICENEAGPTAEDRDRVRKLVQLVTGDVSE